MSRCTFLVVLLASTAVASAESQLDLGPPALESEDRAIVGGTNVPPGKWPDAVAVLGDGACTGTLIAPTVVLTAGHCADMNPTTVVANTVDYGAAGGIKVAVERTIAYPNWENTYDVAVIMLAQPVTGVTPRKLGTACTFQPFSASTSVRLVGFGATDMLGTAANTLLKEATTLVTDPMCSGGNGCNPSVAPGGEFVAGGTGTADSCFGDSGGPVYLDTARGPIVIGAVSRGVNASATPCGGGGIYVRTDKIVPWIEQTAGVPVSKDLCAADPDEGDGGSGSGGGNGGGGNGGGTGEPGGEDFVSGDVIGGCSSSHPGGAGGLLLLALAFVTRRRRARPDGAKPAEAKPAEAKPAEARPAEAATSHGTWRPRV